MHRLQTVGNFEVHSIVLGNCVTKLALFNEAKTNARRDVHKVRKTVHSAVEVRPDRLDLVTLNKRRCEHLNSPVHEQSRSKHPSNWYHESS
jgi:hypothetical protein